MLYLLTIPFYKFGLMSWNLEWMCMQKGMEMEGNELVNSYPSSSLQAEEPIFQWHRIKAGSVMTRP